MTIIENNGLNTHDVYLHNTHNVYVCQCFQLFWIFRLEKDNFVETRVAIEKNIIKNSFHCLSHNNIVIISTVCDTVSREQHLFYARAIKMPR